jgi:hypothetical protein
VKRHRLTFLLYIVCLATPLSAGKPDCTPDQIADLARAADLIVVATVHEVRAPAGNATNEDGSMRRFVKFHIEKIMKGKFSDHYLVAGYENIQNDLNALSDSPDISLKTFHKGNKLLLLLPKEPAHRATRMDYPDVTLHTFFPPDCGTLPASGHNQRRVRKVLMEQKG